MYAIVDIAGKQYKVSEGAKLKVASLDKNTGGNVSFDKVLLTDNGKSVKVGTPTLKGVNINATILEHGRERKILIYKKKRRKGYQRKNGHRQGYTLIEITKIKATTGTTKRAPTKSKKEKQETMKEGK
ncbi:MAG TPA: 50S ribosomal protein L21 [Candidatus Marinimicrobia bacterium]|nr:50S ribosomal protein L21 [Candidatus Neomarinimicrobiota bacterium]